MTEQSTLGRFTSGRSLALFDNTEAVVATVHGSLVFVDISGFTALSERLAALGREGAEELTEVLSRVFGDMIDLASRRGGTLLKFGGDALLMLFESSDHAVQAASAGVEMRAALRKAAEIPTSVGKVQLRMSQGIHSGEVHIFRASGAHTELVVAGPAASWVTRMEGSADASEIVVSSETRALLPRESAVDRKGDGWLLRWRSAKTAPCGVVGMGPAYDGDESPIPVALRGYLGAATVESEHRQAAVAFVKIPEIDDRLEAVGVESAAIELADLVAEISSIAEDEGVTFLATDVDEGAVKVILVSGVPSTEVDESGRMLRAVRRIADVQSPFGLKIGVNGGHVFSGEIGSYHRSTFTIMGDTVNIAARMMSAAPPGVIYASPGVVAASRTLFETAEVEPFHAKGKSEPVRAFSVGLETGVRADERSSQGVFVGRDRELGELLQMVAQLADGIGGAVAVTGPTGIGKSRLIEELVGDSPFRVLEVRAEPYGSANPYRPFRDLVRSLLGVSRGENADMAAELGKAVTALASDLRPFVPLVADVAHIDVPPTDETRHIEGRFRQERTADILIELFESILSDPIVFIAEDMHWADAASQALLGRIVRDAKARSWFVVATGREYSISNAVTMELEPLGEFALEEIIHASTEAAPFRPDVVSAIVTRAGGSPLFTEELVSAVRETGEVSSLPMSLDGVVGSQIDSLPPLSRRVLRYLSVLGRSFRVSVARDLIKTQGVALDAATRQTLGAFLDDDGADRMQFRHALVRDVAYEGLPFRRRRDLHLRAGNLVLDGVGASTDGVADILALHFYLGGDAPLAWKYCNLAGDKNMAMFANAEAAAEFERAIEVSRKLASVDDDQRRDLYVKLGDVRERSGDFDASLRAYRSAARLAREDPVEKGAVLLKRARAKERAGSYSAALADTTRVRGLIRDVETTAARELDAQTLSYVALIRQAQQKPKHSLVAASEAVAAATSVGDELALARAWRVLDWVYIMRGELEKALHSIDALEVYQRVGNLEGEAGVSTNLGAFAFWRGDWESALQYYELGRDASTKAGNLVDAAVAAANIGEVLVNQGRFEDARDPLLEARRVWLASEFFEGVAFVDLLLGRMYGLEGDLEQSETALKESMRRSTELGLDGDALEAAVFLGDAVCRAGAPLAGLEIIEQARAQTSSEYLDHHSPLVARVRGSILDAASRTDEAIPVLSAGIAIADERDDEYELALLVLTLQRVAPDLVDESQVVDAKRALSSLGVQSALGISL